LAWHGVARWFVFNIKKTIWVILGGSCNGKGSYISWRPQGLFYFRLVYFMTVWYMFCSFGIFWYVAPIKIWQPWLGIRCHFRYHEIEIDFCSSPTEHLKSIRTLTFRSARQGDQIGRIFAYWAVVYFGQFFKDCQIYAKF
jgi:hypothetical protein